MEIIKPIIQAIKKWYQGEYLPHSPVSSVHCNLTIEQITRGYFKRPLIVRFLIYIKRFWIKHWYVLLPAIVVLLGIIVTLFIHFDSAHNR